MKKLHPIAIFLIWISSILAVSAELKDTTDEFLKAFKNADTESMSKYYAESIKFLGDHKFTGKARSIDPVELTKEELNRCYIKLFKLVKKERWAKLTANLKPTIEISKAGGLYKGLVKKGDIIYNVHFRQAVKGKDKGLDEAVIFIFRKISGKYLIVSHIADY